MTQHSKINKLNEDNSDLFRQIEDLQAQVEILSRSQQEFLDLKRRVELALDGTGIGLWEANLRSGEIKVNKNWMAMLGYDDVIENDQYSAWKQRVHPDDLQNILAFFSKPSAEDDAVFEFEYRIRTHDGDWKWFLDCGRVIEWTDTGMPLRAVGTNRDITRQKDAEARLRKMAMYDVLTGLPNRRFCEDLLTRELALARRNQFKLGAVYLDLDDFKSVNDKHGHDVGDLLLKQVSGRMLTCIRDSDAVARLGGDEFLIVLQGRNSAGFHEILERMSRLLSSPFDLNGIVIQVSCSIGVAIFPDDAADMNELVRRADEAMYEVKSSGKNNYKFV